KKRKYEEGKSKRKKHNMSVKKRIGDNGRTTVDGE
ncbi:hypothetical protein Tco_1382988, partial [Tanacetum coccineum]